MAKKKEYKRYVTPEGEVTLAYLDKPSDKYDKDGAYSVKMKWLKKDIAPLLDELQAEFDNAIEEGRAKFAELPAASRKKLGEMKVGSLFTPVYDDEDNETDYVEMSFKMKAVGKDKDGEPVARRPAIFAASGGAPLRKVPRISRGTIGQVSFAVVPYFMASAGEAGLSKYLNAFQIIDLVEYGGGSASSYGFGAKEGYTPEADEPSDDGEEAEDEDEEAEEAEEAPKSSKTKKRSAVDF